MMLYVIRNAQPGEYVSTFKFGITNAACFSTSVIFRHELQNLMAAITDAEAFRELWAGPNFSEGQNLVHTNAFRGCLAFGRASII